MNPQPGFLVAGASKAGSTWLSGVLKDHPEVYIPPGPTLDYFGRRYDKGLDWYLSHFKGCSGQKAIGEKSTSYIIEDDVPERIHAWNPEVRLIFVLREPVERAYSHYTMHLRAAMVSDDADKELHPGSELVREGLYHHQLSRFLKLFSREQMLILLYDDLRADQDAFFARVCEFLGVDPAVRPESMQGKAHVRKGQPRFPTLFRWRVRSQRWLAARSTTADRVFRSLQRSTFLNTSRLLNPEPKYPVWSPEAKRRIAELYEPDVEKLGRMLGRDLSHWLARYRAPAPT